jgi:DNA-binding NtrC family response regulator
MTAEPTSRADSPSPSATLTERILVVEDDERFRRTLTEVLGAHGYEVLSTADGLSALDVLQEVRVDLVISDLVMPGMRGEALVAHITATFPEIPVVAITAFGSVEDALELTRGGAADYLTKPFRTRALFTSIERVLDQTRLRREQARLRRALGDHLEGIIGASEPMRRLFERIGRVATSPAPVLITGESGTGKELVARAVHRASGRGAFVPVNCAALPDHLLESEIFGHARGAFTGADREKKGLLEAADGGTLFLDEIAELPLTLQPKLLRAVEAGEVRRVGDVEGRAVDVRILAATHRDLGALVRAEEFREDLFWRLHVLHLDVPPLRGRRADIPLLVEGFLSELAARERAPESRVSPSALAALVELPWPGNVRQLFNVLERAIAFAAGVEIGLEDLPDEVRTTGHSAAFVRSAAGREVTLADVERDYVLEILRRTGGNKTRAAELLGIPRRSLYRRLERYGSPSAEERDDPA